MNNLNNNKLYYGSTINVRDGIAIIVGLLKVLVIFDSLKASCCLSSNGAPRFLF